MTYGIKYFLPRIRLYKSSKRGSDLEKIAERVLSGRDLGKFYSNSASKRVYFRFGKARTGTSTSTVTSATAPVASLNAASSVPTSVVSSVITSVASSVPTIVVPSVITSVVSSVPTIVVPSVITSVTSSVPTSVASSVSTSVALSVSTVTVPSVATHIVSSVVDNSQITIPSYIAPSMSSLTTGIQNPAMSSGSCDEDWETVGTILADNSHVGLLDDGVAIDQELERTGEQLLCERRLHGDDALPVFLNLTFEEMSYQAAQDRKLIVVAVLSADETSCAHLARLLSGVSKTRHTYFWVAEAESLSGRLVKRKFGEQNKDTELFVLAPTTSVLNPILVDRFSGDPLMATSIEDVKEALERGASTLVSLGLECDRLMQRRGLIQEQDWELEKSMQLDKQKREHIRIEDEDQEETAATDQVAPIQDVQVTNEAIREERKKRVTPAPKEGLHVVINLPKEDRIGRYFHRNAFFQEVYDWAGSMEKVPLFFTLHSGQELKRPDEKIRCHCVIHLQERVEEEMATIFDCQVSFKGTVPSGDSNLSETLPDETPQAEENLGPSKAKKLKEERESHSGKEENKDKEKKKRKRRKKVKKAVEEKTASVNNVEI